MRWALWTLVLAFGTCFGALALMGPVGETARLWMSRPNSARAVRAWRSSNGPVDQRELLEELGPCSADEEDEDARPIHAASSHPLSALAVRLSLSPGLLASPPHQLVVSIFRMYCILLL
jgi:hypothetical protein